MSKKTRPELTPEQFLKQCELELTILVAGIVKEYASMKQVTAGEIQCPRCMTECLRFSIATNGHLRAVCKRVVGERDGRDIHCMNIIE